MLREIGCGLTSLSVVLFCTSLLSAEPPKREPGDLWRVSIKGREQSLGRATIPDSVDLAKRLDERAAVELEPVPAPRHHVSVDVQSTLLRMSFHPAAVVTGRRASADAEWKESIRPAEELDQELRTQLLRFPRFHTADFVQVADFKGWVKLPEAQGQEILEFRSTQAPGMTISGRHQQLYAPPYMIDDVGLRPGQRYLLLRSQIGQRDWYYQAFPYEGAISKLIEEAPPIPKSFSTDKVDREKDVTQLRYYFSHIDHEDPLVAGVAAETVSGLVSETLVKAGTGLDIDKLRKEVNNPVWSRRVRTAFTVLLASHRQPHDAPPIWATLQQSVPGRYDSRLTLAYTLTLGDQAFETLDQKSKDSWQWNEATVMLTRTLQKMPDVVSRPTVVKFLRRQLDDPKSLNMAVGDLQAWKDWDYQDELVKKLAVPIQGDVIDFLLTCLEDQPDNVEPGKAPHQIKARAHLDRLRAEYPDLVKAVEQERAEQKQQRSM